MSTAGTSLLPVEVRPLQYRITLGPNLTDFTFWGEETIAIEVRQATSQIVLNAAELDIQAAHLLHAGRTMPAQEIHSDAKAETVTLAFVLAKKIIRRLRFRRWC